MTSEERLRELEEKYEGYKVYDNQGGKIGKVDDLFVDESDSEEYIGVKLGLFGTKSTLIPMEIVRVNEADRAIEVSDSKDHIKDAPTFSDDDEITAEYEDRIRSHFGLESLATSSSRGSYGAYSGADTSSGTDYDSDESSARSSETSQGRGESTDSESSAADTDYGERTGSSVGAAGSSDAEYREQAGSSTVTSGTSDTGHEGRSESSSGTAAGTSGGSTEGFGTGESTGEQETSGTPGSRRTEETVTVEEGGRTKVRRRIVREEIIEEDPGS
jgi:hypothetical protein